MSSWDPDVRRLLLAGGGVLSAADAIGAGVPREALTDAVRNGQLTRLRRGVLVDAATWDASPPWERHSIRTRAVARHLTPEEVRTHAFSHQSALALQDVAVFGVDERVHLVRTDGRRSRHGGMMAGHPPVDPSWVTTVAGVRVVRPALAVVQAAAVAGVEAGLVSADSALFTGKVTARELHDAEHVAGIGKKHGAAQLAVRLADGRRESPGESRSWWLFRCGGLPTPELQIDVYADDGSLLGRPDFLWREAGVLGEFDGAVKYATPDALRAEKWRQDRFGDAGYQIFRIGWADLDRPRIVLERARAAFARAGHPLHVPA